MTKRNQWQYLALVVVLTAFLVGFGTGPKTAEAISLGGVLKGALKVLSIGYMVKTFGGQINSFINSALAQHSAEIAGQTKVVPILKIGSGGAAIGAAQVMGPAQQVEKVKAVVELEWRPGTVLRARGLFPIASTNITKPDIVKGTGVSANIKFPL